MTIDRLTDLLQNRQKIIPIVLLGIAAFSGLTALAKATGYFLASHKAVNIVEQAIERSEPDSNDVEKEIAKAKPIAEALKKKNLFSPPSPKQHPIQSVLGIFGDEAFINGKWYKVGAKVGEAKILAIGADSVTAEWEGKEKVFHPIDGSGESAPGGPRSRPSRSSPKLGGPGGGPADMVVVRSPTTQARGPSGGSGARGGSGGSPRGRFSEMSEAERTKLRARMQEARERYSQMSEAEREKFRAEMRERFGGGRGDRGGRR
jgi:hypothetical protein